MNGFPEHSVVRITRLLQANRPIQGSEKVMRPPLMGDIGAIVHVYAPSLYAVEMVDSDGLTIWLADFEREELELV